MDFLLHEREGLLLLFAIVALPFAIYFDNKMKKQRYSEYAKMGFSPITKQKFMRWAKLEHFSILGRMGFFQNSHEYMIGKYQGHTVGLFLHIVADGSKTGKRQTAALITLEEKMPHFVLRPEWFRDKVKAKFGNEDINFENDPLFSKKYFLQGRKIEKIKVIFNNRKVRHYFSQHDGIWLESDGSKLLIFQEHDMLTDGKRLHRIVTRAIKIKSLLEDPEKNYAIDVNLGKSDTSIPVQMPPSTEWNQKNIAIVLAVLITVLSLVFYTYTDSRQSYDERMTKYGTMSTQEMAAYLADINADAERLDAVTLHSGTDVNGSTITFYRLLESNLLSDMIIDLEDMNSEKDRMTRKLKQEMCGLPTWDLFYNKGGEVVFSYHMEDDGKKIFLFNINVNQAFCQ